MALPIESKPSILFVSDNFAEKFIPGSLLYSSISAEILSKWIDVNASGSSHGEYEAAAHPFRFRLFPAACARWCYSARKTRRTLDGFRAQRARHRDTNAFPNERHHTRA